MKTTIKTLYQKGYNKTQIGRMLGIDRKTVRKVLKTDTEVPKQAEPKLSVWPSMLDDCTSSTTSTLSFYHIFEKISPDD